MARRHRPLQARTRPKPTAGRVLYLRGDKWVEATKEDIQARHQGAVLTIPTEVMATWEKQRSANATGAGGYSDQVLYALKPDSTVQVPQYVRDVWWFVEDVNSHDRTLTVDTLIFDCRLERKFPFELVSTWVQPNTSEQRVEVATALDRIRELRAQAEREEDEVQVLAA